MLDNSKWIAAAGIDGCPEFIKRFDAARQVSRAVLTVTAAGVYSAKLNGSRVGSFFLAPVGRCTISATKCRNTM